jgi:hypothetical protein
MNYYTKGGQAHGLQALAQELPKYGRYNDDMVAHISSDEARLLKSLGGSGTINPTTGLPEFGMFGIGGGGGILGTGINKNASDPVSNTLSNNPISQGVSKGVQQASNFVDQGLVGLDKTIGKAIPGGWGTVGMVAGSMMGLPTPVMMGMGALNGSGVLHKGGKFNLQGAMLGGAMAYATSELGEYMRGAADGAAEGVKEGAVAATKEAAMAPVSATAAEMTADEVARNAANEMTKSLASESANILREIPQPNTMMQNVFQGNFGDAASQFGTKLSEGASQFGTDISNSASNAYKTVMDPATYSDLGTKASNYAGDRATDFKETLSGGKNLLGLGEGTAKEAAAQAAKVAAAEGTMKPLLAAGVVGYTGMGLAALDEQRKFLEESKAANRISQEEYDKEAAQIEAGRQDAIRAVSGSPWDTNPNRDVSIGDTYYDRGDSKDTLYKNNPYSYAYGGMVNPPDDQTGMLSQSPLADDFGLSNLYGSMQPQPSAGYSQSFYPPNDGYGQGMNYAAGGEVPGFAFGGSYSASASGEAGSMPTGGGGMFGGLGGILGGLMPRIIEAIASPTPDAGKEAVAAHSWNTEPDITVPNLGSTLYHNNPTLTYEDAANRLLYKQDKSNDGSSYGKYGENYADGGLAPRFLSGGGDGMSDSIKANIGGEQEARLADGEFVVPADVVSHLGNGSSKAGAKQLYSMMDRVRTARTGRKSQGKQINPKKYMAG